MIVSQLRNKLLCYDNNLYKISYIAVANYELYAERSGNTNMYLLLSTPSRAKGSSCLLNVQPLRHKT